jgi:hypothetical protein
VLLRKVKNLQRIFLLLFQGLLFYQRRSLYVFERFQILAGCEKSFKYELFICKLSKISDYDLESIQKIIELLKESWLKIETNTKATLAQYQG